MKDLNFFIKTIEKDLSDKYVAANISATNAANKSFNLKDFNSMPTTPTSILKKVEDQVKAMAQKNTVSTNNKQYMSNTCPNIA